MVKTAHREFPKQHFKSLHVALRSGVSRYATTTKDGVELIACCWYDKRPKYIIATAGSNTAAPPHGRTRYRLLSDGTCQQFSKFTNISAVPYEYFSNAQKIDVHNHRRQGVLAMERCIGTHSWSFRIITTVLAMCMVDAYMMYKYDAVDGEPAMEFSAFASECAHSLCVNTVTASSARGVRRPRDEGEIDEARRARPGVCSLIQLRRLIPTEVGRHRRKICVVCGAKASACCWRCSTPDKPVSLCGPAAQGGMSCLTAHVDMLQQQ
jgi:hypothetical protein